MVASSGVAIRRVFLLSAAHRAARAPRFTSQLFSPVSRFSAAPLIGAFLCVGQAIWASYMAFVYLSSPAAAVGSLWQIGSFVQLPRTGCRPAAAAGSSRRARGRPRARRGWGRASEWVWLRSFLADLLPAARAACGACPMAVALSSVVIRNRLGWQNRRPRPFPACPRLAGPGHRERLLAALGAVVADALRTVAAALAGRRQSTASVLRCAASTAYRRAARRCRPSCWRKRGGPCRRRGSRRWRRRSLPDLAATGTARQEAHVGVILRVPQRAEAADGVGASEFCSPVLVEPDPTADEASSSRRA